LLSGYWGDVVWGVVAGTRNAQSCSTGAKRVGGKWISEYLWKVAKSKTKDCDL